jgi:hypothetical protein
LRPHSLTCVIFLVLALRRVYYLEADLWKDRKEELEQTLLMVEREKTERRQSMQHSNIERDESYLVDRKPWIPHPEQRDTVPNVELYSVLVGGLPSLPTNVLHRDEVGAVFSRKQSIDWQLAVTTAFFDHCVPNQPGFSSSIAAVTVLPSALHLTEAWNQWYKVAAKLRRLRFIRKEINKRQKKARKKEDPDLEEGGGGPLKTQQKPRSRMRNASTKSNHSGVYGHTDEKDEYYHEVLGSTGDLQVEDKLLYAMHFGPEQIAAYAREFALGAANLAPYGWHERRVLKANMSELITMERAAVEAVHEANVALREAQDRIGEDSSEGEELSHEKLHEIMRNVEIESFGSDDSDSEVSLADNPPNSGCEYSSADTCDPSCVPGVSAVMFSTTGADDEASFGEANSSCNAPQEYHVQLKEDGTERKTRLKRSSSSSSLWSGGSTSEDSTDSRSISGRLGGRQSTRHSDRKKKASRADSGSARLPGNLGLEAGLWMEQKPLLPQGESIVGRTKAPRGSKSALGHSMHGLHGHRVDRLSRTKSLDEIDMAFSSTASLSEQKDGSIALQRTTSCDNVDLLENRSESEKASSATTALREKVTHDNEAIQLGPPKESIWDRLQKDQERKLNLRNRLNSRQLIFEAGSVVQSVTTEHSTPPVSPTSAAISAKAKSDATKDAIDRQFRPLVGKVSKRPMSRSDQESRLQDPSPSMQCQIRQMDIRLSIHSGLRPSHQMDVDSVVNANCLAVETETAFGSERQPILTMNDPHQTFSENQVEDNLRIALDFEQKAGLRHREVGAVKHDDDVIHDLDDKWTRVKAIVQEAEAGKARPGTKGHQISTGAWKLPMRQKILRRVRKAFLSKWKCCYRMKPPQLVDEFVRDSSYAVVTFTSRQAAVAARHCLADSRGHDRWITVSDIPSPPLADAPVFNMSSFRGCVRPVTLSISDKQKMVRHALAMGLLATIYFFYTIPLTLAHSVVTPEKLSNAFPEIFKEQKNSVLLSNIFSGLLSALVWTAFFAACPPMFKVRLVRLVDTWFIAHRRCTHTRLPER